MSHIIDKMTAFHSVVEQILETAKRYPHSSALDNAARQLTYGELDQGSNRFAGYLLQLGVMPGDTVAISMERSFDWIIASLGVMRIGAAYVPLDSAWPDSRLRFAVKDSGASALIARAPLLDRLKVEARGIDPGRDSESIAAVSGAKCQFPSPGTLAYLIYTSGSSGVPKGVEITHANLAHLVRWHLSAFKVTSKDRASHLAGLGFDAAVWEIWPNLCAGATVCLTDDSVRSSPEMIQSWTMREHVTISFVPTVHAAQLVKMKWPADTSLRLLLTGGEALSRSPAKGLPFDVINNYGPTECTVVATSTQLQAASNEVPPIGRPIAGATVYLLDEDGRYVPDGKTGEIYIGGGGVARGYRNLPEATSRSFMPDPFSEIAGTHIYRTGDRGRRRPDGQIEFCGRLDRQVKIRGHRIELDEIGRILADHPSVEFATVITNNSDRGEARLVAYVLPRAVDAPPASDELQQYLQRILPIYMVPAIFVRLRALPLSLNGKVDLTMLDKPSRNNRLGKADHQSAPSSVIEGKVLRLIREILENDGISQQENFFLAGGHSLLGMQLVLRLREVFGVDLTLQQLFEAPTTERLSAAIRRELMAEHLERIWSDLLGQEKVKREDDFFGQGGNTDLVADLQRRIILELGDHVTFEELMRNSTLKDQVELIHGRPQLTPSLARDATVPQSHTDRGKLFWVHYLHASLAEAMGEDRPMVLLRLAEEDLLSLGETPTFANIAAFLVGMVLSTQVAGPYTIGGFCVGGLLAFEIASQLRAAGHEVSLLILVDPPSPSDFSLDNLMGSRLSNPGYLVKRLMRLGFQATFNKLRERIVGLLRVPKKARLDNPVQARIELAASLYRPGKYEGRTLLLLAHDHPPHLNFLPGWQTIIPDDMHTKYINAHHSELFSTQAVRSVANSILTHLRSVSRQEHALICDPASTFTTAASSQANTE